MNQLPVRSLSPIQLGDTLTYTTFVVDEAELKVDDDENRPKLSPEEARKKLQEFVATLCLIIALTTT